MHFHCKICLLLCVPTCLCNAQICRWVLLGKIMCDSVSQISIQSPEPLLMHLLKLDLLLIGFLGCILVCSNEYIRLFSLIHGRSTHFVIWSPISNTFKFGDFESSEHQWHLVLLSSYGLESSLLRCTFYLILGAMSKWFYIDTIE